MVKNISIFGMAFIAGSVAMFSNQARADVLLIVDLTVANEVTIRATDGLSANTVTGSNQVGTYLDNFYNFPGDGELNAILVSGDLTSAENVSDNSPNLYRGGEGADAGMDSGLNIWDWTDDFPASFTADSLAFVGSATWTLAPDDYADMLAGNSSGNIYFPADTADDVVSASFLGTYLVVVPAPGVLPLLGLGFGLGVRRWR